MKKIICISSVVLLAVLAFGCASVNQEELILGKWETPAGDRSLEFRGDGTVTVTENGKPLFGRFRVLRKDWLQIVYDDPKISRDLKFSVSQDEFVLCQNFDRIPVTFQRVAGPAASGAPDTNDMARVLEQTTAKAEAGDAYSQAVLAGLYNRGYGGLIRRPDSGDAKKWATLSADQGHPMGKFHLGYAISGPRVPREAKDLFAECAGGLTGLAEQGDQYAQCCLGDMYWRGLGTREDARRAHDWFLKAAEQGNVNAEYSLGRIYHSGRLGEQNLEQAAHWFKKAADKGNPFAADQYGFCLRDIDKQKAGKP